LFVIVGHPAAGVTSVGGTTGGVTGGATAGGLLIVMFPPEPGEEISSAPQPARLAATIPATTIRTGFMEQLPG
jgi:hypothetical protein